MAGDWQKDAPWCRKREQRQLRTCTAKYTGTAGSNDSGRDIAMKNGPSGPLSIS